METPQCLSGQPVPVCDQLHCKNSIFFEWEFMFEFMAITLCPFTVYHCEESGLVLLSSGVDTR